MGKAKQQFENSLYKDAYKEATILLAEAQHGLNAGKRGYRACAVTNKVKKSCLSGCNKKLNPQTVKNLWIVNFDETEHKQSTKVKGGVQRQQY